MSEQTHARPPLLPPEIFMAVAQSAERYRAAKLISIFDPEAHATVMGAIADGSVTTWHVLAPSTAESTRAFLLGEVERGTYTEDEVVFLRMEEVPTDPGAFN